MKKTILILAAVFICISIGLLSPACSTTESESSATASEKVGSAGEAYKPLNLTVFIDLSDRLERENVIPSQAYNDTAIINHLVDLFIKDCLKKKIIMSKNKFQVIFYPTPSKTDIQTIAKSLKVDLSKLPATEKKKVILDMKTKIPQNLGIIYNETLKTKKWVGCDIWGFFSSKKVDQYCIIPGYRNVLVILTDGYLFHMNHKIQEGKAYSYILPQTLAQEGSSLIVKRDDLKDLEVLMLEVNPYNPMQTEKLVGVLENWFVGMGLDRNNFVINETDLETHVETVIDSFIEK